MKKGLSNVQRRASKAAEHYQRDSTAVSGPASVMRLSRGASIVAMACGMSVLAGCGGSNTVSNPIQQFTASSATIVAGQTVNLSWQVSGAQSVSLSGVSATPASSAVVAPSQTTTYTLTATASGQPFTKSVTVNVSADPSIASAVVDPTHPGTAIAPGYIGFSHEWGQAQLLMGVPSVGTNPIYRQLLANLSAYGGGPVSIRVGGNSTDTTGEPTANTIPPFAQLYQDMSSPTSGVSFILGVNLGSDNVALATDQAKQYVQGMPSGSIRAIEIGNEPDFYFENGYRSSTYSFTQYASDFQTFATSILSAVPNSPLLMGPSDATYPGSALSPTLTTSMLTTGNLSSLLQQSGSQMGIVSQHSYEGVSSNCGGSPQPGFLLQPLSSTDNPTKAAPYAAIAQAAGKPFRIGEMNSIACSGTPGISNAFEASLWAPDIMFEYAKIGAAGVNFHSNDWNSFKQWDAYAAFQFNVPQSQYQASNAITPPPGTQFSSQYSVRAIQSLYYGMLFFAEATPDQAQLLPVTLTTSANLKAWATLDPTTGHVTVAIINKDQSASGSVQLTVPGYTSGVVKRMLAPSFSSTTGITLAGQTFDGSQDGKPIGTAYGEIAGSQNGTFQVSVGPTSALLLTLTK